MIHGLGVVLIFWRNLFSEERNSFFIQLIIWTSVLALVVSINGDSGFLRAYLVSDNFHYFSEISTFYLVKSKNAVQLFKCNHRSKYWVWLLPGRIFSRISFYQGITYQIGGSPCRVMVKVMDCGIVVNEFELQSRYSYLSFWWSWPCEQYVSMQETTSIAGCWDKVSNVR